MIMSISILPFNYSYFNSLLLLMALLSCQLPFPSKVAADAKQNPLFPAGRTLTIEIYRFTGQGKQAEKVLAGKVAEGHDVTVSVTRSDIGMTGVTSLPSGLKIPKGRTLDITVKRAAGSPTTMQTSGMGKGASGKSSTPQFPTGRSLTIETYRFTGQGKQAEKVLVGKVAEGHDVTVSVTRSDIGMTGLTALPSGLKIPKGRTLGITVKRAADSSTTMQTGDMGKGASGKSSTPRFPTGHSLTIETYRFTGQGKQAEKVLAGKVAGGHDVTVSVTRSDIGMTGVTSLPSGLKIPKGRTLDITVKCAADSSTTMQTGGMSKGTSDKSSGQQFPTGRSLTIETYRFTGKGKKAEKVLAEKVAKGHDVTVSVTRSDIGITGVTSLPSGLKIPKGRTLDITVKRAADSSTTMQTGGMGKGASGKSSTPQFPTGRSLAIETYRFTGKGKQAEKVLAGKVAKGHDVTVTVTRSGIGMTGLTALPSGLKIPKGRILDITVKRGTPEFFGGIISKEPSQTKTSPPPGKKKIELTRVTTIFGVNPFNRNSLKQTFGTGPVPLRVTTGVPFTVAGADGIEVQIDVAGPDTIQMIPHVGAGPSGFPLESAMVYIAPVPPAEFLYDSGGADIPGFTGIVPGSTAFSFAPNGSLLRFVSKRKSDGTFFTITLSAVTSGTVLSPSVTITSIYGYRCGNTSGNCP